MKKNKYLFVCYMLLAIVVASGIFTRTYISLEERQKDGAKIHVVTSFYPIYIAALNVAQNSPDIVLDNLSEPQTGCLHDYQLTPQDMILLSKADLFLVNGNGIENFLADVGAAYPQLTISQASQGIELISTEQGFWQEEHGDETHAHQEGNAHAWMDTRLYAQMVQKIADDLAGADPANQELYQENAQRYCEKVQELTNQMSELKELAEGMPVVILHEAFAYVTQQLGMENLYCLNLDEERQVSAREAADMIGEITKRQGTIVFAEELYGKDIGNTVETETGAKVFYLDTLVRGDGQEDSYLDMTRQNIETLRSVLSQANK